jgi:hypothetical protein
MNDEQELIWNYMLQNAVGYSHRKTSTQIREACQLQSGGPTNEHIRDLIRDMIFTHRCCIGSLMWVNGFWIIQTLAELNKVAQSLEVRADAIHHRAATLRRNWEINQ